MQAMLLSVDKQKAEFIDAPFDFEKLYELINCSTIELAYRKIDGITFMFCLDEEGLFVQEQKISAVDIAMKPMFVGSFVVFGLDEEGGARDLNEVEMQTLIKHVEYIGTQNYPSGLLMLRDLEYEV